MKTTSRFLFLTALLAGSAHASVTFNITGGVFASTTSGHPAFADGNLVQLIASPTNSTFASPTADSFVNDDDLLLGSAAVDHTLLGVNGSVSFSLIVDYANFPTLTSGASLLLRWYDLVSGATSPGAGTAYGEFRTDSSVDGGDPWFMPVDGSQITLNFITTDLDPQGSQSPTAGLAVSVIPESSTCAAFLGGISVLTAFIFRRRSSSIVR